LGIHLFGPLFSARTRFSLCLSCIIFLRKLRPRFFGDDKAISNNGDPKTVDPFHRKFTSRSIKSDQKTTATVVSNGRHKRLWRVFFLTFSPILGMGLQMERWLEIALKRFLKHSNKKLLFCWYYPECSCALILANIASH
jgi:hypothetical protein